ncbi:MAG: DUF4926 domain-containing protein, partial [Flavisolibacter sp.]|nr:DUF4926 domain-containing protein [Flavisolibacter sp.]
MLLNHERINKRIRCSAIGTVVHVYNHHFYEVEFAGLKGQTYALLTLPAEQLLLLKHEPQGCKAAPAIYRIIISMGNVVPRRRLRAALSFLSEHYGEPR